MLSGAQNAAMTTALTAAVLGVTAGTAAGWSPGVLKAMTSSTLLYRALAGALSGFSSGMAQGGSLESATQQGVINSYLSVINPFASVLPPLGAASVNSMLSSIANQAISTGEVNLAAVITSMGMRALFGLATGGASPVDFGSAFALGIANGLFSSTARATGGW